MSRPLAWSVAGFAHWAAVFALLYGVQGLGCAVGWGPGLHRGLLVVLWAAGLGVSGLILALLRRVELPGRAWRRIAWACNLAALVAVIWTGLPVVFTTTC